MVSSSSNFLKNKILAALSNADLALLQPHLEPVELEVRKVLEEPNKPIMHSYFIERGLASIVAGNSHKRLEVGLIGSEGMTGLPIVLGNDRSPHENFIQVAGEGSRISANKLREAMQQSRSLERVFLGFAHSFMNQTAIPPSRTARPLLRSGWHAGCSWPMTVWTVTRYRSLMSFCH